MPGMAESNGQDRSKSSGRTYTDEEWENMKMPFYHYYIEKNLSLKESAKRMSENHGFEATLRQWERRIAPEKWGFTKYASRDERLAAIQAAGRTLLEVSCRGRRKSTASDGRPSLNEDRNMRRFARREVSRDKVDSRQRAKSVSELSDRSDQDMSGSSAAPSPAPSDMYSVDAHDEMSDFPHINHESAGNLWMQNIPSSTASTMTLPQITIDNADVMHNIGVPQINILAPDEHNSHIRSEQMTIMSRQPQINIQYTQPPQPQIDTTPFPSFATHPSDAFSIVQSPTHTFSNHASPHEQTAFPSNVPWHNSFVPEPNPGADMFNDMSFTQLMAMDSHVLDGDAAIANQSLDAFDESQASSPAHMISRLPTEDDYMEVRDPTHDDVHALLQEHYNKTMQMIGMCVQSCQNASNRDVMMRHLQLLQEGVRAQNTESDRNLRATLKDVASTQRRATQMISDLSTTRRKKIEQLQAQLAGVRERSNSLNVGNASFSYS